jgi:hypothetical protein
MAVQRICDECGKVMTFENRKKEVNVRITDPEFSNIVHRHMEFCSETCVVVHFTRRVCEKGKVQRA